jgi:hypothetical protein
VASWAIANQRGAILTTSIEPLADRAFERGAYANLMQWAKDANTADRAWLYLEAAHIVGQLHFKPHLETHLKMMGLSLRTRDWPEAGGQLLRLALVPMGHLSGRLPLGNPGRSRVSAFTPMAVRPELAELIAHARGH